MSHDVLTKLPCKDDYFNCNDNQSEHGYGSLEDVNSADGCCPNTGNNGSNSGNCSPLSSPGLLTDEVIVDDSVIISANLAKETNVSPHDDGNDFKNKDKESREVKKKSNGEESDRVFLNGNRFRFIPKSRQEDRNSGSLRHNRGNRGPRKHSRSESDASSPPEARPLLYPGGKDDIAFIVKRVDRTLRRTYSESSSEILPVRGILKYPHGWQRRALSESNCDNNLSFNMEGENDDGIARSMESVSQQEESTDDSSPSLTSSSSTPPPSAVLLEKTRNLPEEEKPKKSVHFNCFVSKATFNTNSVILDDRNKRKKNRRKENKSNQTNTAQRTNENNKPKQVHPNQQQQNQATHPVKSNTKPRKGPIKAKNDKNNNHHSTSDDNKPVNHEDDPKDMTENLNSETKMRSRQDSGYDSETNEKKKTMEPTGTTFVKSSKRKFTVNKVDLTQ